MAVKPGTDIGFLSETGALGRTLNQIPGMNALAIIHDIWGGAVGDAAFTFTNVPTMLPAAAVTYAAFGSYTQIGGVLASE